MSKNSGKDKIKKSRLKRDKTEILDVYEVNKINDELNKINNENSLLNKKIKKLEETNINFLKLNNLYKIFIIILLVILGFISIYYKKNTHNTINEVYKEVRVADDNYVFLGDSITEFYDLDKYYKDMPVIKSGVSGYVTKDILDRMDDMVYKYNPSHVFLLIGTNDFQLGYSEDDIVNNISIIIKNIKKNRPLTKIYVESIYPVNNSNDPKINKDAVGIRNNVSIKSVNNKIKKLCDKEKVNYIDFYSILVDKDDMLNLDYTKEGLHISDLGYKIITKEIKKYIN